MKESDLEKALARRLDKVGLGGYEREYVFHDTRRWRLDFAWPELKLAIEVEGGVHTGGRHVSAVGFEADCAKYNAAAICGWTVLRVTGDQVRSGYAVGAIQDWLSADAMRLRLAGVR